MVVMTTQDKIQKIIEKSIEGGWKLKDHFVVYGGCDEFNSPKYKPVFEKIICDTSFWKALGKAMGWTEHTYYLHCPICEDIPDGEPRLFTWNYHSIEFFQINLTQGFDEAVDYLYKLIFNE